MALNIVILFSVFHLFSSNILFGQLPVSCLNEIKCGQFIHFSPDVETRIIRKKDSQTEYFRRSKIKSKVTWIKEDEFLLKITKIKNAELGSINVGSIIHVKIIECNEDYYDFTILFIDEDSDLKEEMSARYYRSR